MSVRAVVAETYRAALPALLASLCGGLVAGVVLGGMRTELETVPGLLVLVPALLATRGNVYGSLGARVATALHQGMVEPRVTAADPRLVRAGVAAVANGLVASAFAALAVFLALSAGGGVVAPLPALVAVALIAGICSGVTLTLVIVTAVFVGYRRGIDPDTLVGPLVTTSGDVFGVLFLLVAARVVIATGLVGGVG